MVINGLSMVIDDERKVFFKIIVNGSRGIHGLLLMVSNSGLLMVYQ